jgi:hypothetical protein
MICKTVVKATKPPHLFSLLLIFATAVAHTHIAIGIIADDVAFARKRIAFHPGDPDGLATHGAENMWPCLVEKGCLTFVEIKGCIPRVCLVYTAVTEIPACCLRVSE